MKQILVLIFLSTFFSPYCIASDVSQDCVVKYVDTKNLSGDCKADEIIEVWCSKAESNELEIVSQCFAYYEKDSAGNKLKDSKVKCDS